MLAWILLLGVLHGLQPDHAAAALAMSRRGRTPVWRVALRLAGGHALALGLAATVLVHAPAAVSGRVEQVAGLAAAASLLIVGAALLLQCWRGRYVVHRHPHAHAGAAHLHVHAATQAHGGKHRHYGSIGLGLVLGLGGARSIAVLLAAMTGPASATTALALYAGGIAGGVVAVSLLVEAGRRAAESRDWSRWIDAVAGAGATGAGIALLMH